CPLTETHRRELRSGLTGGSELDVELDAAGLDAADVEIVGPPRADVLVDNGDDVGGETTAGDDGGTPTGGGGAGGKGAGGSGAGGNGAGGSGAGGNGAGGRGGT